MDKCLMFFYITFVVFIFTDFPVHSPFTVSACKNDSPRNSPSLPTTEDPDLCYIPSSSILGENKKISCDNREHSHRAKKCIVSMKDDGVFKVTAICDRGIFVIRNMALDSDKLRRCHDYQYDENCSYGNDDLMAYYEFKQSRLSADSKTKRKISAFTHPEPSFGASLSIVCREYCERNQAHKFASPTKCHSFIKKGKISATMTCMMCRRHGCHFGR